jgi:hypothetical protein
MLTLRLRQAERGVVHPAGVPRGLSRKMEDLQRSLIS